MCGIERCTEGRRVLCPTYVRNLPAERHCLARVSTDLSSEDALARLEQTEPDLAEAINQLVTTRDSPGFLVLLKYLDAQAQNAKEAACNVLKRLKKPTMVPKHHRSAISKRRPLVGP